MEIKHITNSLLILLSVLAFASCADNDVYNPDKAQNTGSIKVPANFDWSTTRTTTCSITSPVNTQVSIYSGRECKDSQLLITTPVLKEKATVFSIELPTTTSAYYVQYPTANGKELIEVKNTVSTKASDNSLILPEGTIEEDFENPVPRYHMPAKNTYGTILFEDLYPNKGDYDFNDFVAGYNLSTILGRKDSEENKDIITLKIQIRAIGGNKPYQFGFEFTPLQTKYVRNNYTVESDNKELTIELVSKNDDDPAVFVITGTNNLKDGSFYNTEKISATKMPELTCKITRYNIGDQSPTEQFFNVAMHSSSTNFFLQNINTKEEIHLKGYPVTRLASNADTQFSTEDNFVWGLKVPVSIPHSTEGTDFIKAYPKFAGWVSSGGANNTDWYNTYNTDKVINPN